MIKKKKYLILNYIIFSAFIIIVILNSHIINSETNFKKIKIQPALVKKLTINPSKNVQINLDDFLEITQNTRNKVKLSKIEKKNLDIIQLNNKIKKQVKFKKILKKELKLNVFNNKKIIPLIREKKKVVNIKAKINSKIYKNISQGKSLLKNNKKFDISFKWPVDNNSHDLIYQKLSECLNVKTLILGDNSILYSLDGIINKQLFNNKFSPILRAPNNTYVKAEIENIKKIEKKYNLPFGGKLIRIFDIYTDAFILGRFKEEAIKRSLKLNKFSGVYAIINNKLFLTNLKINNVLIQENINLSLFKKGC